MDGERLMARLESVKHYFLVDQGDFLVHFMDIAEVRAGVSVFFFFFFFFLAQ